MALRFTETTNEHVSVPDDSSYNDIFIQTGGSSLFVVFKPRTGASAAKRFVGKSQLEFRYISSDKVRMDQSFSTTNGQWREASGSLTLDSWHSFGCYYDATSDTNAPTWYTDGTKKTVGSGISETTTPSGTASSDSGTELHIGSSIFDAALECDYALFALWRGVQLSDSEFDALHRGTSPALIRFDKLVLFHNYWTQDAPDLSGTGNHGTLNSSPALVAHAPKLGRYVTSPGYKPPIVLASGNVTVNLTGHSSAASVGTAAPAVDKILTGQASSAAVGATVPEVSNILSGLSSAASIGSLSTLIDDTVTLTGLSSTGNAGAVNAEIAKALTGNNSAAAVGNVTPEIINILSGLSSAAQVGTVTLQIDTTAALSGLSSPTAVGTLIAEVTSILGGVSSTATVGSVSIDVTKILSGLMSPGAVGTLTPEVIKILTGLASASAVGNVTVDTSGNVTVNLAGLDSTADVGALVTVIDDTVSLTGLSSGAQVGSVTIDISDSITLTGLSSAANVGTLSLDVSETIALTGLSSSADVGSVATEITKALTGLQSQGLVGAVFVNTGGAGDATASLSGLASATQVGLMTPANTKPVSGASSSPGIGAVRIFKYQNISELVQNRSLIIDKRDTGKTVNKSTTSFVVDKSDNVYTDDRS